MREVGWITSQNIKQKADRIDRNATDGFGVMLNLGGRTMSDGFETLLDVAG